MMIKGDQRCQTIKRWELHCKDDVLLAHHSLHLKDSVYMH
jgi:hypothetical protein